MAIWNFNSITQSCFLCLVILFSSRIQANPPAATKGGASICFKALQIIQDYSKLSDVQNTEIAFRNSLDITSTHGVEVAHKQVMTTLFLWLKEKKGFNSLTFSELLVDGKFRLPNGTQLKTVGVPLSNDSPIPEFWAFRLEHPDNQIEGRRWIVEVGVSRVQQKVTMQTNVRYFQAIPQLGVIRT